MPLSIQSLSAHHEAQIQNTIDQKTKPPGSLGLLETIAMQLAKLMGPKRITISNPTLLVFAADHGIAEEGVSIAPVEVTRQMVLNFVAGGAAINCFARLNHMQLKVIDCGINADMDIQTLIPHKVAYGTQNFSQEPAMTQQQLERGFMYAKELVKRLDQQGCNIIGIGEMGIGNTTSASALLAAVLNLNASQTVGRGTGINDAVMEKKRQLIQQGLDLHHAHLSDPLQALRCLGGHEIVQMTATMLAAAEHGMLVLVDGFISSVAALLAYRIEPAVLDYMLFSHQSEEAAHIKVLEAMHAEPCLHLKMRLGEGTGAALAMNLVRAAAEFYNEMASFESAGVDGVQP